MTSSEAVEKNEKLVVGIIESYKSYLKTKYRRLISKILTLGRKREKEREERNQTHIILMSF